MSSWAECQNLLCVRADNMGDVIMTGPAIRALKQTFGCHITLLTSSAGAPICDYIPEIDDVIVSDVPWVKTEVPANPDNLADLVNELRSRAFDGVIIFTVFSQSALPAALICLQSAIPRRLAYCRENPYGLLTDWIPDIEPYEIIRHQVERDLFLVRHIGAAIKDDRLKLTYSDADWQRATQLMGPSFMVVHTGVSERKREYPKDRWIPLIRSLRYETRMTVVLTGSKKERAAAMEISDSIKDPSVICMAGELDLGVFIAAIYSASLVVSVNTATSHIAAAAQVPLVVLYAATNPQHTPWKSPSKVLYFPVDEDLQSSNQVIRYAREKFTDDISYPSTELVVKSAMELLALDPSRSLLPL
jgi:ADP-heptose:LPS heptosyltransferase